MTRPEILKVEEKVVIPYRRGKAPFIAYECEKFDDLYREFSQGNASCVGTIAMWCGDETCVMPGDMFKLFDWVICKHIDQKYWEADGKVRPRKHELPDVIANRQNVTFFAGFETDV